jgi:hypothetical protein
MPTALLDIQEQLKTELEAQKAELAGSGGGSGSNRISIKGKMFTLPDGTTDEGPMSAIILDWRFQRAYFPGIYNSSDPQPPVCSASDKVEGNLAPKDTVDSKQSDDGCEPCEKNQWGTAQNGNGRGKACKNTIMLAILPANPTEGMSPWLLELPPTSLKPFLSYVKNIQNKGGMIPAQVTTDLSFVAKKDWPMIEFNNPKPHMHIANVLKIRADAQLVLNN